MLYAGENDTKLVFQDKTMPHVVHVGKHSIYWAAVQQVTSDAVIG